MLPHPGWALPLAVLGYRELSGDLASGHHVRVVGGDHQIAHWKQVVAS
jgi:hypothetical protein